MRIKMIYFIAFLITTISNLNAQIIESSSRKKPLWFNEKPESENYIYYVGFGEHNTLEQAKKAAISNVIIEISRSVKVTADVNSISKTEIKNKQTDKIETEVNFEFVGTVKETGEKITIKGLREVEDYWQLRQSGSKKQYEYWILVRKPQTKHDPNMPLYISYGSAPIWRSAIFPGWGQLYKKEKNKGLTFLIGEALLISGTLISQNMYSYNHDKAYETESLSQRNTYKTNRDTWENIRNISAIGAGTLYIYSLIDAFAAKGAPKYAKLNRLNLSPSIASNSCQINITVNF